MGSMSGPSEMSEPSASSATRPSPPAGGMVIAQDETLAARLRMVRGQGQSLTRRYWHEILGFNYRMTNIAAAIGLAQIERLETILARKRAIGARYRAGLGRLPVTFQQPGEGVFGADWLTSVLLPPGIDRDRIMADMAAGAVETRPVFRCANQMPMYATGEHFPVSEDSLPAASQCRATRS